MVDKTRGLDNAEAKFNQMSMEERSKFGSETLSNFGGRTSRGSARFRGDGLNELIVVTIIAAVDGARCFQASYNAWSRVCCTGDLIARRSHCGYLQTATWPAASVLCCCIQLW